MPTSAELNQRYGKLRASLLARHFAFSRYFRANFFAEGNYLAASQSNPDDPAALEHARSMIERWHVLDHTHENPLSHTGQLLVCLAVEHDLGQADALLLIRLTLQSLGTLFKFSGNHFEGYMLRWDPVTSDNWWVTYGPNGVARPQYCRDFLIGRDGRYRYSIPFDDPCFVSSLCDTDQTYWECVSQFRHMEPSMDELISLIMGYQIVYTLVTDAGVRSEVQQQIARIADYLAEYAYLLVRPTGGFSVRGASNVNPALEFVFNRACQRILGRAFAITRTSEQIGGMAVDTTFETVLQKAGVWPAFKDTYDDYTAAAVAGAALIPLLAPGIMIDLVSLLTLLGVVLEFPDPANPLTGIAQMHIGDGISIPFVPVQIARTLAILDGRAHFEVQNDDGRSEFAGAYALLQVADPRLRFKAYMKGATFAGNYGANFAIPCGLLGLDDPDLTAALAYCAWLPLRREKERDDSTNAVHGPFASAVSVVLGAGPIEEDLLLQKLGAWYEEYPAGEARVDWVRNEGVCADYDDTIPELRGKPWLRENTGLEYMSALALAWLHRKRGKSILPGFPDLPDMSSWPPVVVPAAVLAARDQHGFSLVPRQYSRADGQIPSDQDIDLFADPPVKSPEPAPIFPVRGTQAEPIITKTVTIPEGQDWTKLADDQDLGIEILPGYEFSIEAEGAITIDGESYGPEGKDDIVWDRQHPLNGVIDPRNARRYALLGVLRNRFFVGRASARQPFYYWDSDDPSLEDAVSLKLRLNVDAMEAGRLSGAFTCTIRIWNAPQPSRFQQIAHLMDPVSPPTSVRTLASRHRWPAARVPTELSLRQLLGRHNDSRTQSLHFLSYNTCLMELGIPLGRYIREALDLPKLLLAFALDPLDTLQRISEVIPKLLGVSNIEAMPALTMLGIIPTDPLAALKALPVVIEQLLGLTGQTPLDVLFQLGLFEPPPADPLSALERVTDVVEKLLSWYNLPPLLVYGALVGLGIPLPPLLPPLPPPPVFPPPFPPPPLPPPWHPTDQDALNALAAFGGIVRALLDWRQHTPVEALMALGVYVPPPADPISYLAGYPDAVERLLKDVLHLDPLDALARIDPVVGQALSDPSAFLLGIPLTTLLDQVFGLSPLDALSQLIPNPLDVLALFGIEIPEIAIAIKPQVTERAKEIGVALAKDYDLAALCEVWSERTQNLVLEQWRRKPTEVQPPATGIGPDIGQSLLPPAQLPDEVFGSGLLVCGVNRAITKVAEHTFTRNGVTRDLGGADLGWLVDADKWAKKGVMLTRITVGSGTIDLYSAHFYSGGIDEALEKREFFDKLPWPSESDKRSIRAQQVLELADFIQQTHDPRNVAMVVGDFNINANDADPTEYQNLVAQLASVNLYDAWPWQRCQDGRDDPGCTIGDEGRADHERFALVCPVDATDDRYCADPASAESQGQRLDYIFVEQPSVTHTCTLDLTRIRRRPFTRSNATGDDERSMSDHLGLDVTLIVSPQDRC